MGTVLRGDSAANPDREGWSRSLQGTGWERSREDACDPVWGSVRVAGCVTLP